jgi:aspartate--ammonia ligase
MNAIRADEELGNLHSLYVDQWDWELCIGASDRTITFLKSVVRRIYAAIRQTEFLLYEQYPVLHPGLPDEITFIHSEELLKRYPTQPERTGKRVHPRTQSRLHLWYRRPPVQRQQTRRTRTVYDDWITTNEDGYQGLNGAPLRMERRYGLRPRIVIHGHPCRQGSHAQATGHLWLRRAQGSLLPQETAQQRFTSLHRWWYRTVKALFVPAEKAHIGEIQASIWPAECARPVKKTGIILI